MSDSQTIFRAHRTERDKWTNVLNETIRDKRISFRATGLLVYLLSLPRDWKAHQSHIATCKTEGRDAVVTAWDELRKHGYISKELLREKGKIVTTIWNIYETPEDRITEKPETVEPETVNPELQKTEGKERQIKETSPTAPVSESSIKSKVEEIALPVELDSDEFVSAWDDWMAYRRERRFKSYTPIFAVAQLAMLAGWGQKKAIASIRHSIAQGWQGIFEIHEKATRSNSTDRNAGTFNAGKSGRFKGIERLSAAPETQGA